MYTPTTTRPGTTVAIQKAALHGTDASPANGCKECVKTGLAILPVVPIALPNALRGANAEAAQQSKDFMLDAGTTHSLTGPINRVYNTHGI